MQETEKPLESHRHGQRKRGPLTWLRTLAARLWCVLREIANLLHPCRFSILVVVAGAALLLMSAQGREVAVGLVNAPVLWQGVAFHISVFLWAFQSWYWARLMMTMVHGADRDHAPQGRLYRPHEAWVKQHGPRVIAASAYLVAGGALLFAGAWGHFLAAAIAGVLFYWLLVRRVAVVEKIRAGRGETSPVASDTPLRSFIGDPQRSLSSLRDLPPLSKIILGLSIALAVLVTVWVFIDAVGFGWALGSAAVAFLGFALIVPGGSVLVYWSRFGGTEGRVLGASGYPVVTSLLLLALIVGIWVDNHSVRTTGALPDHRADLRAVALQWHAQAAAASGSDQPPLVIVATAGGGIRAAYWTATVLGRLHDANPEFRNYLFGISGVSGGSLGATVFVTLLADGTAGLDTALCTTEAVGGGRAVERNLYECAGQEVLSRDFLAPTAAAMLFPDLMQRFVPLTLFPDRAQALEQGWEQAWARVGLADDTWIGRPFSRIWADEPTAPHLPALLLNGTHVESGKRIITSNLVIDGSHFHDAYDYYGLASGDLLPSTAAHNSARFTYVSPAGTLTRDDKAVGHIVDGGYFENFGAVTAKELLVGVTAALEAAGKKVRPVLIQISNDPGLGDDELAVDRVEPPLDREPSSWANETLSPLRTMINTRNARGVLAYKEFMRAVDDPRRRAHFRLCTVEGHVDPALGWVLAPESKRRMQNLIRSDECGAKTAVEKVLAAITRHDV